MDEASNAPLLSEDTTSVPDSESVKLLSAEEERPQPNPVVSSEGEDIIQGKVETAEQLVSEVSKLADGVSFHYAGPLTPDTETTVPDESTPRFTVSEAVLQKNSPVLMERAVASRMAGYSSCCLHASEVGTLCEFTLLGLCVANGRWDVGYREGLDIGALARFVSRCTKWQLPPAVSQGAFAALAARVAPENAVEAFSWGNEVSCVPLSALARGIITLRGSLCLRKFCSDMNKGVMGGIKLEDAEEILSMKCIAATEDDLAEFMFAVTDAANLVPARNKDLQEDAAARRTRLWEKIDKMRLSGTMLTSPIVKNLLQINDMYLPALERHAQGIAGRAFRRHGVFGIAKGKMVAGYRRITSKEFSKAVSLLKAQCKAEGGATLPLLDDGEEMGAFSVDDRGIVAKDANNWDVNLFYDGEPLALRSVRYYDALDESEQAQDSLVRGMCLIGTGGVSPDLWDVTGKGHWTWDPAPKNGVSFGLWIIASVSL